MYASNPGIILYKPAKDICIKFCHGLFTHKLRLLVMRKRTGQCRQTEQRTDNREETKSAIVFATLDSREREKETPRRTQGEAKFFGSQ